MCGVLLSRAIDSPAARKALKQLRKIALSFPEVKERPSHSTPTFFVRDKKVLVHPWDNHHKNTVSASGARVRSVVEDAFRLVAPKSLFKQLDT